MSGDEMIVEDHNFFDEELPFRNSDGSFLTSQIEEKNSTLIRPS